MTDEKGRRFMIEIHNVTKNFDKIKAVDEVSVTIKEKTVFGLIGTNGAGKSTVLRMVAGVLKPDEGTVAVDNMPIYDNVEAKKKLFFIADEPYFLPMPTPRPWSIIIAVFLRILIKWNFTNIWRSSIWTREGGLTLFPKA